MIQEIILKTKKNKKLMLNWNGKYVVAYKLKKTKYLVLKFGANILMLKVLL